MQNIVTLKGVCLGYGREL